MKRIFFISLYIIFGVSLAQGMDISDKNEGKNGARPTSITARSKVFEKHFVQNINNDDREIFEFMKSWHEEDYAALAQTVKLYENQGKIKFIHDTLNETFENGNVTHAKIAAAYAAYGIIISSKSEMELTGNSENAENEENVDKAIQNIKKYIENGIWIHVYTNEYSGMARREKNNLRWLYSNGFRAIAYK